MQNQKTMEDLQNQPTVNDRVQPKLLTPEELDNELLDRQGTAQTLIANNKSSMPEQLDSSDNNHIGHSLTTVTNQTLNGTRKGHLKARSQHSIGGMSGTFNARNNNFVTQNSKKSMFNKQMIK